MDLQGRIKGLRDEKGWSRENLAKRFCKTEGAIRTWENGIAKPNVEDLIKLSEIFECTTDYLLGITDCREVDEKIKLEGLYAEIENAMVEVWNRDECLKHIIYFLNVIPKEDRHSVAKPLFEIARQLALVLESVYKSLDSLEKAEKFNSKEYAKCHIDISTAVVEAKRQAEAVFTVPNKKLVVQMQKAFPELDSVMVNLLTNNSHSPYEMPINPNFNTISKLK